MQDVKSLYAFREVRNDTTTTRTSKQVSTPRKAHNSLSNAILRDVLLVLLWLETFLLQDIHLFSPFPRTKDNANLSFSRLRF